MKEHVVWLLLVTAPLLSESNSKIFRDDILHRDFQNSNMEFTLEIYKRLTKMSTDGNLFCSPFSISAAMSMVYLGAREQTAAQMVSPLSIQSLGQRVHEAYEDYLKVMAKNENVTLRIANRLYPNSKAEIVPSFIELCAKHYQTDIKSTDYEHFETARKEINEWVSQQTAEKIKDVLPQGSLNPLTIMVLVNAIYFKGDWETQFDDNGTRDMTFHTLKGQHRTVKMMFKKERKLPLKHDDELKCEVLELPYKGKSLSMVIILPDDKDGLSALEEKLTPSKLHSLMKDMPPTKVVVFLPKFKVKSGFELSTLFEQMGMTDLFEELKADLSGIDESRMTFVSAIFHQAFVDVNEQGTEAAAVTLAVAVIVSVPLQFKADHPFMFVIRDNRSDTILFIGRFVDVVSSQEKDEL
ncbi:leukocyte elastase inhibitor-like [Mizuhopecten yessoensis]|uniref:Leukocyte elastase inhibitor n=1 Tax=Mizuhopecten yessoensis TaxID=6573 RepID=A0A210PWL6_MIZYE|nr:leukocyte elastase inhibitor-like [Mizuhopecten yessoensis]XP_021373335.1 leukocyte elastase inhibitor-like [Mizuhopecten yessoensis]XP_021373336.1 leukocyte elastase inhibitor-like [Mizuhopecten yessoensis]XP_021373337.1 leukocyte elastase inhibitor-like [Mizuhopecten yessoensis]OWF40881.1 Leukocyte elastase inhibitor [Mizuhopecten yessoensis]